MDEKLGYEAERSGVQGSVAKKSRLKGDKVKKGVEVLRTYEW